MRGERARACSPTAADGAAGDDARIDEARERRGGAAGDVICVLQFDAASLAVLDRMLAAGRLPALAGLTERGRRLELETPADHFAAGAFHTLYSGVELGDHGLFYPFQWSAAEQRARYATAFQAPPAVWERLARAGLRTLAIDPYESRPPATRDGTFVCGWGFERPGRAAALVAAGAAGRALRAPLRARARTRPRSSAARGRATCSALREKLVAAPGRVATLAEELLARERFDLAWLTFSAAHLAGHQFWDLSQLDARRRPARAGCSGARSTTSTPRSTTAFGARARARCPPAPT